MTKNPLKLLSRPDFKVPKPPRTLGQAGTNLWDRIVAEYVLDDAGGRELLTLCCQALDRAEALKQQIDAEGETVKVKGVLRDHPALKHELQNRSFVAKALARMGLNLEVPIRPVGRPLVGGLGVGSEYTRRLTNDAS